MTARKLQLSDDKLQRLRIQSAESRHPHMLLDVFIIRSMIDELLKSRGVEVEVENIEPKRRKKK